MSVSARLRNWLQLRAVPRRSPDPVLYFFPFSIHSILVRFAIALALSKSRPSRDLTRLTYRLVNLHRNENLAEDYLLQLNPRGQVSTLTAPSLPSHLTDSLSISYWVCDQCPDLLPAAHRPTICRLLSRLHLILANNNPNPALEDLLARSDITPAHRCALEYKRECQRKERKLASLAVPDGEGTTRHTISFLTDVANQHDEFNRGGIWIFGDGVGPTVLDAHVVAFVARLVDIGLADLVPPKMLAYAEAVMELPEWEEVTKGRPTVWNPSIGPVEELRM